MWPIKGLSWIRRSLAGVRSVVWRRSSHCHCMDLEELVDEPEGTICRGLSGSALSRCFKAVIVDHDLIVMALS